MRRTILITGATGLIGSRLAEALKERGEHVIALTTRPEAAKPKLPFAEVAAWENYISLAGQRIDVIVNLAGINMGKRRWNDKFKKSLYSSRIETTGRIVELISRMREKPEVLLNASGVDYYGDRGEEDVFEDSPHSDDFAGKLCADWEKEAFKAENRGVRVTAVRTGFVIARESEAVKRLARAFRFFAGGPPGSGKQYISWIHIDDIIGIYLFCMDNSSVSGPVNAAAPNPETMRDFCRNLASAIHRPSYLPVPGFLVRIAAGEVAVLVLNGRRALPGKIIRFGYRFKFKNSADAWKDVYK